MWDVKSYDSPCKELRDEFNLNKLIKKIRDKKKWSVSDCRELLTKLYTYQIICYRHEKERENDYISSLIRYIQYKEKIIKDYEGRIFTIITTIFLPLSFMVGFFGMNFKGMGVPSLKKGIYNIKNPEYYVISISIITIIIGLSVFYTLIM